MKSLCILSILALSSMALAQEQQILAKISDKAKVGIIVSLAPNLKTLNVIYESEIEKIKHGYSDGITEINVLDVRDDMYSGQCVADMVVKIQYGRAEVSPSDGSKPVLKTDLISLKNVYLDVDCAYLTNPNTILFTGQNRISSDTNENKIVVKSRLDKTGDYESAPSTTVIRSSAKIIER